MSKYSPVGKSKYLVAAVILFIVISTAFAVDPQKPDTSKVGSRPEKTVDPAKIQAKDSGAKQQDTSGKKILDTAVNKKPDISKLPVTDSVNAQANTQNQKEPDSVIYKRTTVSDEELKRGERLFNGLVYLDNKSINCASCHNTNEIDSLNWNPDALEISRKYIHKSAKELSTVLLKPAGPKMKIVHNGFQLSAEDIVMLKAYMNTFAATGLKKDKPVITNLLLLIIAFILFSVALVSLIIKKIIINKRINYAILTVTGVFITWILAVNAIAIGRSKGFEPAQPIKFSHAVHAGQNKTDCNYCHYTAKTSKTAGIPAGSVCLNCHFLVRNGTRSGATEISKVIAALDEKRAVPWVRIYKLPDFVFFSHEQHVSAGQINCEACHGDVKKMNRLYQYSDLSMGWCIDCHKTRKVNISNEYYKAYYPTLYDSVRTGKIDSIRVVGIGGRDCGKCHY
jgi:cytochrome c553